MHFDWKGLIGGIAPTIATVASGGNPLVGAGVSALSKALFGKKDGSKEEVAKAISSVYESGDPVKIAEIELKIKEAENNLKIELERIGVRYEELDVRREEIAAQDRGDARGMQRAAIAGDDKFVRRFIYWYAIYMTTVSFIYFFCVTFIELPDDGKRYADIILGFLLGSGLGVVVAFFYGTSNGTLAKNKQIADLAQRAGGRG